MRNSSLKYHSDEKPGKITIIPSKPCANSQQLSMAYTPGVAYPCLEIEKNPNDAYKYTSKSNLVGVISNGTAVLGLGNIGALAGKPVMEGKGVLFKRFADIDVFDIEIAEKDPKKFVEIVAALEPTFGGINLEDIKAPDCFYIESELKKRMNIPVFHDDQHGTAIITAASILNALEIAQKDIKKIKLIVSGAGSAAIAITKLLLDIGLEKKNVWMFDSKGLVFKKRKDLNEYKKFFAQDSGEVLLADAMKGADVFIGVSTGNLLSQAMMKSMAKDPIIFALANPVPEVTPFKAKKARPDVIMGTGRSDFPNQINNVLGFPYIFRGALDVKASDITSEMKLAAVKALAELAHTPTPKEVFDAYGEEFTFGRDYIIPKPFDPRILYKVAPAVADAAMKSGVARENIKDLKAYEEKLKEISQRLSKAEFC